MARKPKGFRTGHDDSLACPHRDVSVCRKCATQYAEIVEVYGRHYWIAMLPNVAHYLPSEKRTATLSAYENL